ncbi:CYtochrome P450 family [Aphelenchoides bicaudatus]|nr:CYtochrome P450 family [Aphelenchoides bicaudatus]
MLQIGKEAPGTQALERWRKEYGDVFTYWLGNTPFVALCSFDSIQEVLVNNADSCTDREFFDDFYRLIRGKKDGIFNINGAVWREHSSFIYRSFKNSGIGKESFESGVLSELEWLFESVNKELTKNEGFVEQLSHCVDVFVASTVNLWLLGYTFGGNKSEEFLEIKRSVVEFMAYSGEPLPSIVRCCPKVFAPLPYFRNVVKEIRTKIEAMHSYFEKQIKGLGDGKLTENEEITDECYVSSFLKESENREGRDNFDAETLVGMLRDFWIAGQDTVTNTLEWGLIFMILNQDKQDKLHEELNRVIGEERND